MKTGMPTMGTPWCTASSTPCMPQCVTKRRVRGWASTACCGTCNMVWNCRTLHYTYQLTQLTTMTLSGAARVQCSLSSFMMTRCGSRENTDIRPAIVACGTA